MTWAMLGASTGRNGGGVVEEGEGHHRAGEDGLWGIGGGFRERLPFSFAASQNPLKILRSVTPVKPRGNSNDGYRMLTGTRGAYRESPTHNTPRRHVMTADTHMYT